MRTTKCVANWATVKSMQDGHLTAVASNATLDRDGEVILPSAFTRHLDVYRANPVILAAHVHRGYEGTPTIIGSATRIEAADEALMFEMTFARTPLAQQWQSLYEDGHARAFSVGFIPLDGEWRDPPSSNGKAGAVYVHTEVELLEISAVAVPANRDALARDFDPAELERLIDARVQRTLERLCARQMLKWLDGKE